LCHRFKRLAEFDLAGKPVEEFAPVSADPASSGELQIHLLARSFRPSEGLPAGSIIRQAMVLSRYSFPVQQGGGHRQLGGNLGKIVLLFHHSSPWLSPKHLPFPRIPKTSGFHPNLTKISS
jgi:hypothetical protein